MRESTVQFIKEMEGIFDEINPTLGEEDKLKIIEKHLKGNSIKLGQVRLIKPGTEEYKGFSEKFMENYGATKRSRFYRIR